MRGTGEGLDSLWSCSLMKCGGGDGKAPYRTRGRDGVGGYGRDSGRYGAGIIDNGRGKVGYNRTYSTALLK